MKIKYKMSLIGIATMVAVVFAVTFAQVNNASKLSKDLSIKIIESVNSEQAEYWSGRLNGYVRALRTLANVMAGFEDLAPETRRTIYDDMLLSATEAEETFFALSTVWKPNAIDGIRLPNCAKCEKSFFRFKGAQQHVIIYGPPCFWR